MPKREAWSRLMVIRSRGAIREKIGRDIGELRQRAQLLQHLLRPFDSSAILASCSVYWKLPRAMRAPTLMSWVGCKEHVGAFDPGELRPQPVDDLARRMRSRSSRGLSTMKKRPVFAAGVAVPPVLPVCEPEACDVGIAQDHRAQLLLKPHHLLGRDLLRRLGEAGEHAGILDREKALRDLDHHPDGAAPWWRRTPRA